jgi:RNA polymerase sigma factor (sigma-70 family)
MSVPPDGRAFVDEREATMTDWGDQLDRLVRERGPALLRYAYLLTGDPSAAEEVVQDALVAVLARRNLLRDPGAVEGYVRRAILSRYLDGYRRGRRWSGVRHLLARPASTEGLSDAVDARTDVIAALAHLSPRVRGCIVLRFYEDLSVADTAERLGLSTGAVKRYTSDGVQALERVLGPVLVPDDMVTVRSTSALADGRAAVPGPRTAGQRSER